jgi:hypothetical protein
VAGFERLEGASEQRWRSLLGRKVSVRFKLTGDPDHPFSETIGVVMSVKTDETGTSRVAIVDRRGDVSEIDISDVIAGKAWVEGTPGR